MWSVGVRLGVDVVGRTCITHDDYFGIYALLIPGRRRAVPSRIIGHSSDVDGGWECHGGQGFGGGGGGGEG